LFQKSNRFPNDIDAFPVWLAVEMLLADGECVQVAGNKGEFLKLRGGTSIIIIIITLNDTMAALVTIPCNFDDGKQR